MTTSRIPTIHSSDESDGALHTVLLAGATGMLGGAVAGQLLKRPGVRLRVLAREGSLSDAAKKERLRVLEAGGATIVFGDLADADSLRRASVGIDVVVSTLQGDRSVIVDGQLALAQAAFEQGASRILPSDFALDLFAATPGEHPSFDARREADTAIADVGIEHIHVLNGAFLDGMVDMNFDHRNRTVSYWGTGNELFEATTVDDTATFTARAAVDPALISGPLGVVGDRVSAHSMADAVDRLTGSHYTRRSKGTVDDLRSLLADARDSGDPQAQTFAAYSLYMATGQTQVRNPQNDRYPDIQFDTFVDVARRRFGESS